jgi:hypothetical protein
MVAAVSYLIDVLVLFLVPDFGRQINPLLVVAPTIGEVWMVLYLLVVGVRSSAEDRKSNIFPVPVVVAP